MAAARRNDLAARQEDVGHVDRLVQQAARIAAQIQYHALNLLPDLTPCFCQCLGQVRGGLPVEAHDADVRDIAIGAVAHGRWHNAGSFEPNLERIGLAFASQPKMYLRVDRSTQPFDPLADGEAGNRSMVDVGNSVVDLESGARGGSVWQN